MAASLITGQNARGTSTTTSVTATYPGATTLGNTLVAIVHANIAVGTGGVTGFTNNIDGPFSAGAQEVSIWSKIADGTETTITATGYTLASQMRIHIYEWSGLMATITLDGTNASTSGISNVTSLLSGSLTTTNANDVIIVAHATGGSTTAHAYDSSFTLAQTDAAAIRLFDGYLIVGATGTYSTTGSWTTAVRAGSAIAAFQVAASGPVVRGNRLSLLGVG